MNLNENFKGGLLITSGMLILAITDNYVRFISEDIGLWQFHLIRSLIAVPAMILFANLRSYDFWPKNLKLVALRTAILVLAMFIYFGSQDREVHPSSINFVYASLYPGGVLTIPFSKTVGFYQIFGLPKRTVGHPWLAIR